MVNHKYMTNYKVINAIKVGQMKSKHLQTKDSQLMASHTFMNAVEQREVGQGLGA